MERGVVNLKSLYEFVQKNRERRDVLFSNAYRDTFLNLTKHVAQHPGFYLWGRYSDKSYWSSIYLGKAGFGHTTNLRNRLREELKDERAAILRSILSKNELHAIREVRHGEKYKSGWTNAMRKEGSTHIAWVAAPDVPEKNIVLVEADLIEALNPTANRVRPKPPETVQEAATQIFEAFRKEIHAARAQAYKLSIVAEAG